MEQKMQKIYDSLANGHLFNILFYFMYHLELEVLYE